MTRFDGRRASYTIIGMFKIVAVFSIAVAIVLALLAVITLIVGRRSRPTHEEAKKRFIYRVEPHADQVTQTPNRLEDNEITRG